MSYYDIHHAWKEREAIRCARQQAEAARQATAANDDDLGATLELVERLAGENNQ